jgi:NhaA family Na+:H+ antiporter
LIAQAEGKSASFTCKRDRISHPSTVQTAVSLSMSENNNKSPVATAIDDFMQLESASGILLLVAAIIAMVVANSPLAHFYNALLDTRVAVQVGALLISKPLLLWINDGLMAVFFFLVGLEIKREVMEGELSSFSQIILPGMGALGGMAVPAAIYAWMNWGDPIALDGWAIPVATDIAFALGLLSVFGSRVPTTLKVFLLTLAIFDDLAAIVIIALFYSGDLSLMALLVGGLSLLMAVVMNLSGVTRTSGYILLGIILWVAVLKSGVHATLAGVLIALCVPMRNAEDQSPLRGLEHDLHTPVAFAILPLFAFANAGLLLTGMSVDDLIHPVTTGIVLGLVLGKPLGILIFVGLAILLRLAVLPKGTTWGQLFGAACACGIGFTMSLFIAGLAFEHGSGEYFAGDRLGILVGSLLSAIIAYGVLQSSLPRSHPDE